MSGCEVNVQIKVRDKASRRLKRHMADWERTAKKLLKAGATKADVDAATARIEIILCRMIEVEPVK
jgi:hypothetical protein